MKNLEADLRHPTRY